MTIQQTGTVQVLGPATGNGWDDLLPAFPWEHAKAIAARYVLSLPGATIQKADRQGPGTPAEQREEHEVVVRALAAAVEEAITGRHAATDAARLRAALAAAEKERDAAYDVITSVADALIAAGHDDDLPAITGQYPEVIARLAAERDAALARADRLAGEKTE